MKNQRKKNGNGVKSKKKARRKKKENIVKVGKEKIDKRN